jgi:hypothetical protein
MTFPVRVMRNRLAAARFVFAFGTTIPRSVRQYGSTAIRQSDEVTKVLLVRMGCLRPHFTRYVPISEYFETTCHHPVISNEILRKPYCRIAVLAVP